MLSYANYFVFIYLYLLYLHSPCSFKDSFISTIKIFRNILKPVRLSRIKKIIIARVKEIHEKI